MVDNTAAAAFVVFVVVEDCVVVVVVVVVVGVVAGKVAPVYFEKERTLSEEAFAPGRYFARRNRCSHRQVKAGAYTALQKNFEQNVHLDLMNCFAVVWPLPTRTEIKFRP